MMCYNNIVPCAWNGDHARSWEFYLPHSMTRRMPTVWSGILDQRSSQLRTTSGGDMLWADAQLHTGHDMRNKRISIKEVKHNAA